MNATLLSLTQVALVLGLAPLSVGIIRKGKARMQNRRGASVFQPYWALASLGRKEMTITRHSSWVFRVVPFAVLGTAFALAILVPTFGIGGAFALERNNILLIAALLVIGSLFLVFGGMDAASTFGGMGSSREITLAAMVEPAAILVFITLGFVAQSWHLDGILQSFTNAPWYNGSPFILITLLALAFVILAENARYPVDNPATHLELTMVHEAMILEYSGPYLAMLEWAAAIKLTVLSVLFMNLLLPFGFVGAAGSIGAIGGLASFLIKLVLASLTIAFLESTIVKMRFYRMQEYMSMAYFLALGGLILTLVFRA